MKSKSLSVLILLAVVVLAAGCSRNNYPQTSGNGDISTNAIPYTVAANYFVNNTLNAESTVSKRIDTQAEFSEYFGMATTMGSQPTPIDFNSQYVIAVIKPETFRATSLDVANLTFYRDIVTLSYTQTPGQAQSYSIRPALIVVVDRKYDGEVLIVEKNS